MKQPMRLSALRGQWQAVALAAACAMLLALLLVAGVQRAARLQSASTALQLAASLADEPQLARAQLTLIQRGLETRTWVGDSLRTIDARRQAADKALAQLARSLGGAGLAAGDEALRLREQAQHDWQALGQGLASLQDDAGGDLYVDLATGSVLSPRGQSLKHSIDQLLATQQATSTRLGDELARLAARLREHVVATGASLRALLLGGAALAALLLATMLYFAWRARRSAVAAAAAEQQVTDLLGTVREGLFLVGRDGRLGAAHSRSLVALVRNEHPAGQSFEDLLRPLVDARTLQAATRFLALLWKDNINEDLVESVNPLNPVPVSFARAGGAAEQRHLAFTFRRVRGQGGRDYLFGGVADVTDHVVLREELEQLKAESDERATQLLRMLQADPLQVQAFAATVEEAVHRCNGLLRKSGHDARELLAKVDGVFREMHALKGEASALGLASFAQRAHAIEEQLATLRASPSLAGSDFVPLVVRLDELLSHGQELAALHERAAGARAAAPAARDSLEPLLQSLAREVGAASQRSVQLQCEGLALVPASLARPVRDLCVQLVRNAIVHGIEPAAERAAGGKPPTGLVRVRCLRDERGDLSLLVEDDGRGLDPEAIRQRALQRGLIDAGQAAALDRTGTFRMLFQPGFSTSDEVTEHAGRGVGLDVVSATVRQLGGRVGLASTPGQYTRFKLLLPGTAAADRAGDDEASAA